MQKTIFCKKCEKYNKNMLMWEKMPTFAVHKGS